MIELETRVLVARPIEDVFTYVADPANFPNWNSAVQAVDTIAARGDNEVGSTYLMERNLPIGRAVNELEIVSRKRPTEFAIRTIQDRRRLAIASCSRQRMARRSFKSSQRPIWAAPLSFLRRSRGGPSEEASTTISQR